MDAAPLTTAISEDYNDNSSPERRERRESLSENDNGATWSIKKLLSRHASRRYRTLERREPNRLRKKPSYKK